MISYAPLWETMKKRAASTYTLQVNGEISFGTLQMLLKHRGRTLRLHGFPGVHKALLCSQEQSL